MLTAVIETKLIDDIICLTKTLETKQELRHYILFLITKDKKKNLAKMRKIMKKIPNLYDILIYDEETISHSAHKVFMYDNGQLWERV